MVDEIFDDWRYEDAELFDADVRGAEYEPVDVAEAAERATELLDIKTRDGDKYVIPLFAVDDPVPTNQYVLYRPERDSIGWYDRGFGISGTERFAACEKLETKEIGHRLRFWLPTNRTEAELAVDESELPADRVHPADRLTEEEQIGFIAELKRFVRSERDAQRDSNWETYTELGLDVAISRNQVSGPFVHIGRRTLDDGRSGYVFQIAREDDEEIDLRDDEGIFEDSRYVHELRCQGFELIRLVNSRAPLVREL